MKIIQKRKIWFGISVILITASAACLLSWGINLGIDFTGRTLMEFSFSDKGKTLSHQEIENRLGDLDLGKINIQSSGEKSVILRLKDIDEETHQQILDKLKGEDDIKGEDNNEEVKIEAVGEEEIKIEDIEIETTNVELETENNSSGDDSDNSGEEENVNLTEEEHASNPSQEQEGNVIEIIEKRFESIGPVIGSELAEKSIKAIIIVLIGIVLYVGWVFRKVSRPVSSWKYGLIALAALFHDIIITLGVFSILGHFYGVEVGMPFVVALLTILGYSVNDTIVVFDRTRENLLRSAWDDFEEVVNRSVNETLVRSLNTSLTTLVVLLAIYFFGGATIQYFVLALIVGIIAGTYSSIFIASPLLVSLARRKKDNEK